MADTVRERALEIAAGWVAQNVAENIVARLQQEGLLARCLCGVGFGQGRDPRCPVHRVETLAGKLPREAMEIRCGDETFHEARPHVEGGETTWTLIRWAPGGGGPIGRLPEATIRARLVGEATSESERVLSFEAIDG